MCTLYQYFFLLFSLFAFSSSVVAQPKSKLRVGVVLPLTGVGAEYALAYRNGMKLAFEDDPTIDSRVAIVTEDHQYDAKQTLSAVRKLDGADNIDLMYVWGFTPSDVIAPVSSSIKVPLLIASINPVALGQKNIVNIESSLSRLMTPLVTYVSQKQYPRVAFVAAQLGALAQGAELVKAKLPQSSVVSTDILELDTKDFRSIITRLRGKDVKAVGLFLAPEQMRLFIEQARGLRYQPDYFGGNTFNEPNVARLFDKVDNGPVFVDSFLESAFALRYEQTFKSSAHVAEAARGYFLIGLLDHVAKSARTHEPESILTSIRSYPAGKGPAGDYHIVDDPSFGCHVAFEPVLNYIRQGKVLVK